MAGSRAPRGAATFLPAMMHPLQPARRRSRLGRAVFAGGMALPALLALTGLACRDAADPPRRRPHVFLVVIDTLRADALGALGSRHATPRLDRLAEESVVFETAIAQSTWTLPSVATLITSLHPTEHGLLGGGAAEEERMPQVLGEERLTLAEAFNRGGYHTIGIVNQVYLRWKYGFGQGFDLYDGLRGHDAFKINERLAKELDQLGLEADPAAAGAVMPDRDPLFVYLHYLDPHWPYDYRIAEEPPPALAAADDDTGLPRLPDLASQWVAEQRDEELRRRALDALAARYALEVQWVDSAIGHLVDLLARRGLWEDTLLVVTSDHGEGFWEHQRLLHGHAPYEEQIRVPLLVRAPPAMGFAGGARAAPVGLIDVMPTLLELAGLPVPPQCRGRSLVPAMRGEEDPERALLVETGRERALRTRDGKVMVRHGATVAGVGGSGDDAARLEYYDLEADPAERSNLAAQCAGAGRCRDGVRRLREAERALLRSEDGPDHPSGVTADEIRELRTLGYVGDGE